MKAPQNLLSVVSSVRVVGHLVECDCHRQHDAFVLAPRDLNLVGVAQREPMLRYAGNRLISAADFVLVVQDISSATKS
jgi:hypothetical protein